MNKNLKSIKFPGLEDTYVIPEGGSIDIDLAGQSGRMFHRGDIDPSHPDVCRYFGTGGSGKCGETGRWEFEFADIGIFLRYADVYGGGCIQKRAFAGSGAGSDGISLCGGLYFKRI